MFDWWRKRKKGVRLRMAEDTNVSLSAARRNEVFTAFPCLASCTSPRADIMRAIVGNVYLALQRGEPVPQLLKPGQLPRGCCRNNDWAADSVTYVTSDTSWDRYDQQRRR
jgi:hypothetical protein